MLKLASAMKVGRNDPCFCGSGRKYKKCHLDKKEASAPFINTTISRSLEERNVIFLSALTDICGLSKKKNWHDFRKEISGDHIKEIYKVFAWLWPLNTNVLSLLPEPSKKLRGFYIGDTRPELIMSNIIRYSLYSDEILVVNPFHHPFTLAPKFNPLINPDQYKQDTIEMVYFLLKLAPWIADGIVKLIPDPINFDPQLRRSVWTMAEERWKRSNLEITEDDIKEMEPEAKAKHKRFLWRLPKPYLEKMIRASIPNISNEDVERTLKGIDADRAKDPLAVDQPMQEGGELLVARKGANLELGLFIAQLTGSYLYTNHRLQWNEILSATNQQQNNESEIWSPLTRSFESLEFKFLNNIDPQFAYELRIEGRLEKFRNFLRKVWLEVGGNPSPDNSYKLARKFGDELQEVYGKTKEEWSEIDKQLLKWITSSGGIAAIISGGMNWQIPAAGFCIAAVLKLLEARRDRKDFRNNVPLAVFLDLENKNKLFT